MALLLPDVVSIPVKTRYPPLQLIVEVVESVTTQFLLLAMAINAHGPRNHPSYYGPGDTLPVMSRGGFKSWVSIAT